MFSRRFGKFESFEDKELFAADLGFAADGPMQIETKVTPVHVGLIDTGDIILCPEAISVGDAGLMGVVSGSPTEPGKIVDMGRPDTFPGIGRSGDGKAAVISNDLLGNS